jgi:hypothetical protein
VRPGRLGSLSRPSRLRVRNPPPKWDASAPLVAFFKPDPDAERFLTATDNAALQTKGAVGVRVTACLVGRTVRPKAGELRTPKTLNFK